MVSQGECGSGAPVPKCNFTEHVNADNTKFTIFDIKTNEAGIWKFVFDQGNSLDFPYGVFSNVHIVDVAGITVPPFSCSSPGPNQTTCTSPLEVKAGTYAVEASSPLLIDGYQQWDIVPLIKTFSVGDKNICGGAMEDQTIAWVRGMTPAEICVTPGTTVTFDWTSGHNMLEVSADSFWSCTGLSKTSPEAGPAIWIAPSVLGLNYFACGVPGHCSNGMKALVEVKAVCPT